MNNDMNDIELGAINKLEIVSEVDFGMYLDGGESGEILLPNNSVPPEAKIGDELDVFIYKDSEDRLIATTDVPLAMVGDIAFLRVVDVNKTGAFLDWGLAKDLMVPFREQKMKMETGKSYLVYLYIDGATDRIVATAKIDNFLNIVPPEYSENEEVDIIIYHKTDLGYKVIINNEHIGLLFQNKIFKEIKPGDTMKGYIKQVREDEKIDVVLQKPGMGEVGSLAEQILETLKNSKGFLPLTDKSEPDAIYASFGISKKLFKKTIGTLYKRRLIELKDDGIYLV